MDIELGENVNGIQFFLVKGTSKVVGTIAHESADHRVVGHYDFPLFRYKLEWIVLAITRAVAEQMVKMYVDDSYESHDHFSLVDFVVLKGSKDV